MNWNQIESNWKQLKGDVQHKWSKLTDDQLDVMLVSLIDESI